MTDLAKVAALPTRAEGLARFIAQQTVDGHPAAVKWLLDGFAKHRPRGDLDEVVFNADAFAAELKGKSWREALRPYFPVRAARDIARENPARPRPAPLHAPSYENIVLLKCYEQRCRKELAEALASGGRLARGEALDAFRIASRALRELVEDLRAVRERETRKALRERNEI